VDERRLPEHEEVTTRFIESRSWPCHCRSCPPCWPPPSPTWPTDWTSAPLSASRCCSLAPSSPEGGAPSPPGSAPVASVRTSATPTPPSAPSGVTVAPLSARGRSVPNWRWPSNCCAGRKPGPLRPSRGSGWSATAPTYRERL